ncbi:LysR substrate-binding domain-containing protein [Stenotrophomonas aracearum]|jgi:DNA-binding transcriptional LysR family regulator|uniref:LysR substrate-binding domain-containing protein n=1 Tax=Stenotrophomonas aracearum TaxID=3003272 RepID=A0ABY9YGC1_9GAMM|nr:LysR substrate-binding domain-containing protein [Stenotrophomonas sp. A5588]WNH49666.1 LysR substrate-binding domain-containing protein [Stenotrophomonas sp. A5588]
MVDLRLLRQFVAVAEELHFHRAAARLHMSQPPLTAAIRRLEEEIGSELILRGNRTLGLTAAGAVLLEEARLLLQQADRALLATQDAAAGRTGSIRLGYVGSALYGRLPEVIRNFRQAHADVRLELIEATSARQIQMLREKRLDVGVVIPPVFDAEDMQLQRFDTDRLAIALPRAHPLAQGDAVTIAELADEPFVLWPAREGRGFHSQVVRLCAAAGFTPRVVQEAHGMHAVLSLVAVEAGISVVPASMVGFRSEEVAYRHLQGDEAGFELHLCVRSDESLPAVRLFLDRS